ncbi:hypothetical protein KPH14_003908 [Odynerus spinipes]|uniref:Uncharacterized protein n=1 Tax=Odynerus spinipes TaxID=1348599 RepID=A0AAD9VUS3_9HYME|nr:hypothetical protein KPH14_003908 [Odynerus spinipes]
MIGRGRVATNYPAIVFLPSSYDTLTWVSVNEQKISRAGAGRKKNEESRRVGYGENVPYWATQHHAGASPAIEWQVEAWKGSGECEGVSQVLLHPPKIRPCNSSKRGTAY